jgi:hypothetical protein
MQGELVTYSNPEHVWKLEGRNVEVTFPDGTIKFSEKLSVLSSNAN